MQEVRISRISQESHPHQDTVQDQHKGIQIITVNCDYNYLNNVTMLR